MVCIPESVNMIEEWRSIEGFSNYQISNKGRIKSFMKSSEGSILFPFVPVRNAWKVIQLKSDNGDYCILQVIDLLLSVFRNEIKGKGNILESMSGNLYSYDIDDYCFKEKVESTNSTEVWKETEYKSYYISDKGNVIRLIHPIQSVKSEPFFIKKELSQQKRKGYYAVKVSLKGVVNKPINIHRLVAKAFIPNTKNKPQVNHIDGNKLNNYVSNLEWCTAKENAIHAHNNQLIALPSNTIPVVGINKKTGELEHYVSLTSASKKTGVDVRYIKQIINKQRVHSMLDFKLDEEPKLKSKVRDRM